MATQQQQTVAAPQQQLRPSAAQQASFFAQQPAKRQKGDDLQGTVSGMRTYGMGRAAQIKWNLSDKGPNSGPLCECRAKGKSARHDLGCEHGIIMAAKKAAGYTERGKLKSQ
mmetsp:Transcript_15357/g.46099  ORF Transcript_15357/g.46099 Transcript_15357/m.46099 type:complete len:112 (+) Transcript_15357:516-851(+)